MPSAFCDISTRMKKATTHFIDAVLTQPRRTIKLVTGAALLILLSACGGEKADSDTIKIGVAIPNFDDTFNIYLKDAMDEYAKSKDNVSVVFVDAKEDTARQLGQVENFIVQQMDAIIIMPVNTDATQPMTDRVMGKDIDLVYVNRRPAYLPEGVTYVGSDELAFGETQARFVADNIDGGNVGILMGMLTMEAALLRTQGAEDYLESLDNFNVTRKQTAMWQRTQAMTVMENWLHSSEPLDVVIANNDEMALGAIQALEAANKLDDILVVGIDATPDGVMSIERGALNATVFQDGAAQARGALDAALNAISKTQQDQITWIPAELVSQANVAAFKTSQK
ncbi:sugar ABC transporter substrate-binding protein [Thaumasiovibrio sp. DFM-14]|uniref:sugar ABC transporter substrate-binding protein n=1 Tax=Thaumasiovibrio sp. DFM-14 TaxID=3384792 RepID=UPI0039A0D74B